MDITLPNLPLCNMQPSGRDFVIIHADLITFLATLLNMDTSKSKQQKISLKISKLSGRMKFLQAIPRDMNVQERILEEKLKEKV